MERLLYKKFFDYLFNTYSDKVVADLINMDETEEPPKNKKKKQKKNRKKAKKTEDLTVATNNKQIEKPASKIDK